MTTITAEALGLNLTLTDELKQALKKGALFITTGGTTLRIEEVEPLTENGMTESEERELLKRWKQAEADVKAGRVYKQRPDESVEQFLDRITAE